MSRRTIQGDLARRNGARGGRGTRAAFRLALVLLGVLAAPGAFAQTAQIYATYGPEDRGPGGPIGLAPTGGQTIHLWATTVGGASSVAPCQAGALGGEICGVDFRLEAFDGFQILAFSGAPGFDSGPSALSFVTSALPGTELAANNFDLGVPSAGNRYLGALQVSLPSPGLAPRIEASGQVIGANLEMRNVLLASVLLPEPGFASGLGLGISLLAGLSRSRRRRPGA